MLLNAFHQENFNYTVPVCFVSAWPFLYNNRPTRSKLPFAAECTDLPCLKVNVPSRLRRVEMSLWMETSDRFNHMGVAVFHGSVGGRRGDSAGRRCRFYGASLFSPHGRQRGSERLKSGQLHLGGVQIGHCCTFSTAEQGERLERSMGTLSVCRARSHSSNAGPAFARPFSERARGNEKEKKALGGMGGGCSACIVFVSHHAAECGRERRVTD